jgi:putative peptide zinc metalloprotease protein
MENHYQTLLSEIEAIQVDAKKFAICRENKVFYVGELLFNLVKLLKEGNTPTAIQQILLEKQNINLTPEKIEQVIEENIINKVISNTSPNPADALFSSKYIYGKARLMSGETLHKIARLFQGLFTKYIFIIGFIVTSIISGIFLKEVFRGNSIFDSSMNTQNGLTYILVSYGFLIFIGMFHELGHAAATAHYKIAPKEIGFGFYFIFPVLYTDVSKIWVLNKYRRIVVNLGGIYFQLIIGSVLWLLYHWSLSNAPELLGYIQAVFLTNTVMIIYSMNPFMRNDGYWIYSDLFEIENLSKSAFTYPKKVYSYFAGEHKISFVSGFKKISKEIPLLIYCLTNYMLITLLPFLVYKMSRVNYQKIRLLIANNWHFQGMSYAETGIMISKIVFFYVITTIVIIRTAKMLITTYRTN